MTAPRTYTDTIWVTPRDFDLAKTGLKRCTIRRGTALVGELVLDLTDGARRMRVEITSVDATRTFGDLSLRDAHDEGLESVAELKVDLRSYYEDLNEDDPVTIIRFSPKH